MRWDGKPQKEKARESIDGHVDHVWDVGECCGRQLGHDRGGGRGCTGHEAGGDWPELKSYRVLGIATSMKLAGCRGLALKHQTHLL